jgi:hypothetical protein
MPKKIITLTLIMLFCTAKFANSENYIISNNPNNNSSEFYVELKKIAIKPIKMGSYNLKVFGLKIYQIELYSEKSRFSYDDKFAIVINYQRKFEKDRLVERSIQEIARINDIKDQELLNNYKIKLQEMFFDVDKGDRKTALYNPQEGVKLFLNGVVVGQIKDLLLAKRFMDIWLSDKSAYPKMTMAIKGEDD